MPEVVLGRSNEITVVSWNILLDYTKSKLAKDHEKYVRPQQERLNCIISTLGKLGVSLDVVCLQEVQGKRDGSSSSHGEYIARALGFRSSYWFNHNASRRKGEYIGMFGSKVHAATALQTRHDKVAPTANVCGVSVTGIHNRFEMVGPKRTHQTQDVLTALDESYSAVIMGDTNAVAWEKPHRLIKAAGFVSAFESVGMQNPKTHPSEAYRDIFYDRVRKLAAPHGTASDSIYVRGCEVVDAGVFESETSDHRGVWATIRRIDVDE